MRRHATVLWPTRPQPEAEKGARIGGHPTAREPTAMAAGRPGLPGHLGSVEGNHGHGPTTPLFRSGPSVLSEAVLSHTYKVPIAPVHRLPPGRDLPGRSTFSHGSSVALDLV